MGAPGSVVSTVPAGPAQPLGAAPPLRRYPSPDVDPNYFNHLYGVPSQPSPPRGALAAGTEEDGLGAAGAPRARIEVISYFDWRDSRCAELRGSFIVSADTGVAVGRLILPKSNLVDEASQCLRLLSGRNHRVYTAITLVTPKEAFRQRLVETRVRFKRLSEDDIQAYIGSGEWRGKAGGYAVQGIAGSFVVKMVGSYTNVVGLPLYETTTLLAGEGFPIRFGWLNTVGV